MKTLVLSQQIIQFKNLFAYISWIFVSALIIRIILSLLKAAAIRQGEADEVDKVGKIVKKFSHPGGLTPWQAIWQSFCSWAHHRNIDDYGIPIYIGIIELFLYPILMLANKWTVIGAWLGIKTAAQWKGWREGRTPYNRFLLGNILVISISFLLLTNFISLRTTPYLEREILGSSTIIDYKIDLDGDRQDELVKVIYGPGVSDKHLKIEVYKTGEMISFLEGRFGIQPNYKIEDVNNDGKKEIIIWSGLWDPRLPGEDGVTEETYEGHSAPHRYVVATYKLIRGQYQLWDIYTTKKKYEPFSKEVPKN